MKQVLTISLILCLAIPFFGTYTWLKYRTRVVRREVKHKMMEGMDKEDLTLLVFSKSEAETKLCWKHADEFEFKEQMFDVVAKEETADSVRFWCWTDRKETQLNRQLDALVDYIMGNHPQRKEAQRQFFNFLANLFHSEAPQWRVVVFSDDTLRPFTFDWAYTSFFAPPPPPPPELALLFFSVN